MWSRCALLFVAGIVVTGCSKPKTEEDKLVDTITERLNKPAPKAPPAPPAADFKPYNSPKGVFRINFPGEPRFVDHGPSKPDNRAGMESYVVALLPRQYSVLASHYDEAPDPSTELKRLSEYLLSRTLEGKITDSKDITVKGKPGKEIVIVDDDKARRARLIVDGKDVYQVSIDAPAEEADGDAAKAFVASFELLK